MDAVADVGRDNPGHAGASHDDWHSRNSAYLGASLHWLRLRLRQLAEPPAAPAPPVATPLSSASTSASRWRHWFAGAADGGNVAGTPLALPRPTLDAEVERALVARAAAAEGDPPPALLVLAERLGLNDFERDTLLLCAAPEFDPALAALCATAQRASHCNYPTFALALQALAEPNWEALSAHRPLRHARLIDINQPGATPLTAAALRADERIVSYLKGLNVLDERLAPLLAPVRAPAPLAASQLRVVDEVLQHLRAAAADGLLPVIQLLGADAASRVAVAAQVCAACERGLYQLALDALPTAKADIETLARLWQRDSLLLPIALYVEADALDAAHPETAAALGYLLTRDCGLVVVGLREGSARLGATRLTFEVPLPEPTEQNAAWRSELVAAGVDSAAASAAAAQLAGHFQLNLGDIRRAVQISARRGPAAPPGVAQVWDDCRDLALARLDGLAQRLTPKATWDDLVVNDEVQQLLRQITAQVRNRHRVYTDWGFARRMSRGFGISALFAGESGTGKTMAAEVIANALRLHLYRIDLSAVVSKYIGETEKNLRKLFDAAEAGGAILFFDEADALFGKRSEVKDSHDRYANIEINYLLQRMEAFSGLAILATNMKSALDTAFLRRLRFVVQFAYPGAAERKQLWQKALPEALRHPSIDYDRLARFSLSGGNIHSIALNAAFMAAQAGVALSMAQLLAATRTELRKLEKPVNEAEFR